MESGDAAVLHAVDAHSGELEGHGRLLGGGEVGRAGASNDDRLPVRQRGGSRGK